MPKLRFEMHLGLRTVMGDDVADILMEHLPPLGWADVARKSDVDRIDHRIDTLELHLNKRIDSLEQRFDKHIDGVVSGLWALGAIMCTGFVGMFALIATKF